MKTTATIVTVKDNKRLRKYIRKMELFLDHNVTAQIIKNKKIGESFQRRNKMAKYVVDRMTMNWEGEEQVKIATLFRELCGERGLNKKLKELVSDYVNSKTK